MSKEDDDEGNQPLKGRPQPSQEELEAKSNWYRLVGGLKVLAGAGYLAAVANPGALMVTSMVGTAFFLTGRIVRAIGWATGYKPLANFGARVSDFGVKVAFSPVYAATTVIDGAYSVLSGGDVTHKEGLTGRFNRLTNPLSGMNTVLREKEQKRQNETEQRSTSSASAAKQPTAEPAAPDRSDSKENLSVERAPTSNSHTPELQAHTSTSSHSHPSSDGKEVLTDISKASNYNEAQEVYNRSITPSKSFQMVGEPMAQRDGSTQITWMPPGADPKDTHLQVTCVYDREGKMILAEPTIPEGKPTCVLPPIASNSPKGFETLHMVEGEKQIHSTITHSPPTKRSYTEHSQNVAMTPPPNRGSGAKVHTGRSVGQR